MGVLNGRVRKGGSLEYWIGLVGWGFNECKFGCWLCYIIDLLGLGIVGLRWDG